MTWPKTYEAFFASGESARKSQPCRPSTGRILIPGGSLYPSLAVVMCFNQKRRTSSSSPLPASRDLPLLLPSFASLESFLEILGMVKIFSITARFPIFMGSTHTRSRRHAPFSVVQASRAEEASPGTIIMGYFGRYPSAALANPIRFVEVYFFAAFTFRIMSMDEYDLFTLMTSSALAMLYWADTVTLPVLPSIFVMGNIS
mmetsp:Transcript_19419/g.54557  ORF Transcript_19419/g.54557 Transcript_19419/m.54557 type:complete len:201 (-) Transcript_19419:2272-2874(-)